MRPRSEAEGEGAEIRPVCSAAAAAPCASVAPPDRSLPRSCRLASSGAFRKAYEQGRHLKGQLVVMWLEKGAGPGPSPGGASGENGLRLGVIASRRSFRRSVDRARAKRMLREAFRLNRHRFCGAGVVVLVARPALLAARLVAVEQDLLSLASHGGIMREARD